MARRELLYAVVRESMGRAGVLSASYKFKVLSLDARGRQFLVMIDLARGHGGETDRLAEIEAMVAQSAKARYDILVTAVYWRMNEHVAVGLPSARLTRTTHSRPAALESQPALSSTATQRGAARYEPIQADEVAAFRQALAAGTARPPTAAPAALRTSAPGVVAAAKLSGAGNPLIDSLARDGHPRYALLTGYKDTGLNDAEQQFGALSKTQHGELK